MSSWCGLPGEGIKRCKKGAGKWFSNASLWCLLCYCKRFSCGFLIFLTRSSGKQTKSRCFYSFVPCFFFHGGHHQVGNDYQVKPCLVRLTSREAQVSLLQTLPARKHLESQNSLSLTQTIPIANVGVRCIIGQITVFLSDFRKSPKKTTLSLLYLSLGTISVISFNS